MTVVNQNLPIPAEYLKSSEKFSIVWNDYVNREEDAKSEIINMIKILEGNGYTRSQAIDKIILDHQHLKGFSRITIYRKLPDDMKRKYENSNLIMLPDCYDVSFDTFENDNNLSIETEVDDERRNEIMKQLPKEVIEYADKTGGLSGLSTNKLELLTNRRLKKYPEQQKHLIEKIKDKEKTTDEIKVSDNRARDIVDQTIRDLETGYLRPDQTGTVFTYSGDPLKRDLIKGNKTEAKEPYDYYRDSHDVIKKLMYLLTGYKKEEREYYTKDIINNTNNHRLDIVKSINSEFRVLYGYDEKFIKPILMALEDMHKKLNEEMDSADKKQEMMKE